MKDYARNNFQKENFSEVKRPSKKKANKKTVKFPNHKKIKLWGYLIIFIVLCIIIWAIISKNDKTPTQGQPKIKQTTPSIISNTSNTSPIITTSQTNTNTPAPIATPFENKVSENIEKKPQVSQKESATTMQNIANNQINNEDAPVQEPEKKQQPEIDNQPKFTFYNDLSQQTVQSDAVAKKAKKYIYTYMLQVGSYKTKEAVDAIRAKLLLIGLKPDVSKHGSWYRIDVGPVHSKREGDILKHKLEAAKISGSMLRQVSKKEAPSKTKTEKTSNE